MNKAVKSQLAVLCGPLLLVPSCSPVAIARRKQLNLVLGSVMNSISFQAYSEFLFQHEISSNIG